MGEHGQRFIQFYLWLSMPHTDDVLRRDRPRRNRSLDRWRTLECADNGS